MALLEMVLTPDLRVRGLLVGLPLELIQEARGHQAISRTRNYCSSEPRSWLTVCWRATSPCLNS
jgi:hypothetical protein